MSRRSVMAGGMARGSAAHRNHRDLKGISHQKGFVLHSQINDSAD